LPHAEEPGAVCAESRHYRVHLCFGPNCSARGSRELLPALERAVREEGLAGQVEILATTCRNRCDYGPSLNVYPGPVFYNGIDAPAVREIVRRHLANDEVVAEWVFRPGLAGGRRR
jgi:(2Fe-2S) ferredoxin